MENPFTSLIERLDRIERNILNLNQSLPTNVEKDRNLEDDDLVLVGEAAKITKYKEKYIYELKRKNHIPYHTQANGRGLRFSRKELEAWIRAGRPKIIDETIRNLSKA